jgi:hypothetical protein
VIEFLSCFAYIVSFISETEENILSILKQNGKSTQRTDKSAYGRELYSFKDGKEKQVQ